MDSNMVIEIPLEDIGERYGGLRIINPAADVSIYRSMERYGQISPVVVYRSEEGRYELIDGFKRLRASRRLKGVKGLRARVLDVGGHVCKALILQLNWVGRSIRALEEAMVVHSLYQEDFLTQVEISTLLCRHKSWVCRRISLIERLSDEVQANIKLGLIHTSQGRELAKLPRGNQERAMSVILKYRLTSRETERLVSLLLTGPGWDHESILRCPDKIIYERVPCLSRVKDNRLSEAASVLKRKLISMEHSLKSVTEAVSVNGLSHLTEPDIICLSPVMGRVIRAALLVVDNLKRIISI